MNANPAPMLDDTAPTVVSLDVGSLALVPASAPASAPAADPAVLAAPWPLWQRLAFRYGLLHFVFYAFPSPLTSLLGTVAGLFEWLRQTFGLESVEWLSGRPFSWPGKWTMELGKVHSGWAWLTTWLGDNGYAPYEVIHQRTGSGDTAHQIEKLLVVVAAALFGTLIWSLLQRRPCRHDRLCRWLHLVVRFHLAFIMLSYGLGKFYGGQFGELSLMRQTQPVGDLWPMNMVGAFMQASRPYELFGGGGEVLGGLLLFHPRTALMGAFVTIGVMTNVCALNWLCGVPVKLSSAHLLLFAICLLLPYRHRLWALFVSNRQAPPVDLTVPKPRWLRWPFWLCCSAWVFGNLWLAHLGGIAPKPWLKGQEKSALYGAWSVEGMLIDGTEVPLADATRWQYFAVDKGTLAWAREATGKQSFFDFVWDPATGTAQVKKRGAAADVLAAPWTIEQGTKVVPVDPPLLLRNEERGKQVDGERRTLVLRGQWEGKQIELHTVEKRFRLQTGFRLRQELPDYW